MFGYLAGFCIYTFAMIGIILVGFVIAKKCMMSNSAARNKDKFLQVENALVIEPKKTIYVLKAGDEKFLIASDAERTSFLTKLGSEGLVLKEAACAESHSSEDIERSLKSNIRKKSNFDSYVDTSSYQNNFGGVNELKSNVMNRLLERLR